jgi:hypothetical protein
MRPVAFAAVTVLGACTPAAYAPPARLNPLDTPSGPGAGGTDVQGEVGRLGTVFGPSLVDGNVRVRHAITEHVIVEGETGMAAVTNPGEVVTSSARSTTTPASARTSRDGYTGRGGVILQGVDGAVRGALTVGIGGGYSQVAGGWTSIDVGAGFGGTHRWVRPWFTGDVGMNQPVSPRPFTVAYGDSEDTTLEMTANAIVRGTLGLELGPIDRAFVVGLSVTKVIADSNGAFGADRSSGNDGFIGIAAGFRARL